MEGMLEGISRGGSASESRWSKVRACKPTAYKRYKWALKTLYIRPRLGPREKTMFDNIPRRVSKFAHIHEETTCFECPDCDSPVAAMLVFPNSKQQLVLLGRCTVCFAQGDKRTSYARINCDYEVWNRLMSDDRIPCLREG